MLFIRVDTRSICIYNKQRGVNMEIIEQFIMGKKEEQSLCEDGLFINDDFIAVFDGVTSKSNRTFGEKTGGRAAMEKAVEVMDYMPFDIDATELFEKINSAVLSLYDGESTGEAAVCGIVYSKHKNEIWSLGDCQCRINSQYYPHEKEIDTILSNVRAIVLEIAKIEGATDEELLKHDIGREFILPILKKQHLLANSDSRFGYAVLNGMSFDCNKIEIHTVNDGDTVVLASDGYPFLYSSLEQCENELERTIKENPLCDSSYVSTKGILPGNKSFDDRTFIKFIV